MNETIALVQAMPIYLQMLILFGVALLVATVVALAVYPLLKLTSKRVDSYTLTAFRKRTRGPVFWFIAFLVTVLLWSGLRAEPVEEEVVTNPWFLEVGIKLARTALYICGALLVIRVVGVLADSLRHRYNVDQVNDLRERKILTQMQYIQRVIGIVVFLITAAFILLQFDSVRSLGAGLFTSVGISGIVIGFAAQKSIANLLAGFQIAFTQPIRLNDALIVNGEYGWVEEITLTYVVMRLWDQRRQIVPLQKFIDDTFQNWTRTNAELIGTVFLYMDYTFPVNELREEFERFLPTQELWDERVKAVAVTDNNDKTQTIRILVSAKNAGDTFNLRCATREHLIGWVRENYPQCLPKVRVDAEQFALGQLRNPAAPTA